MPKTCYLETNLAKNRWRICISRPNSWKTSKRQAVDPRQESRFPFPGSSSGCSQEEFLLPRQEKRLPRRPLALRVKQPIAHPVRQPARSYAPSELIASTALKSPSNSTDHLC